MAKMEDLIDDASLNALVDDALTDDDETQKFNASSLLTPRKERGKVPGLTRGSSSGDETIDDAIDPSRLEEASAASSRGNGVPQITFDTIYKRAGLVTDSDAFTVYKLAQLYEDEEIASLDQQARAVAVRAILKSHNVDLERIFDDAVARRDALEGHDERLRQNIGRVEEQVKQENAALQAEIEEFANPRLQRMEANEQRVERLQRDYQRWEDRKAAEQERLSKILEPWGGDERLRATERIVTKPPRDDGYALSGEDVFDDPPGPAASAPRAETEKSNGVNGHGENWAFGEERSAEVSEASTVSVDDDLPSEYVAAARVRAGETDEFDFVRPSLRLPYSVHEGLLAGLACAIWIVAGILLTAQLVVDLEAYAAWGIGFGAPLVLALVFSTIYRRGGWFTGAFMMLMYSSIAAAFVAHYDVEKLTASLRAEPLVFVHEVGLPEAVGDNLRPLAASYADFLAGTFGLTPAAPADAS